MRTCLGDTVIKLKKSKMFLWELASTNELYDFLFESSFEHMLSVMLVLKNNLSCVKKKNKTQKTKAQLKLIKNYTEMHTDNVLIASQASKLLCVNINGSDLDAAGLTSNVCTTTEC